MRVPSLVCIYAFMRVPSFPLPLCACVCVCARAHSLSLSLSLSLSQHKYIHTQGLVSPGRRIVRFNQNARGIPRLFQNGVDKFAISDAYFVQIFCPTGPILYHYVHIYILEREREEESERERESITFMHICVFVCAFICLCASACVTI